MPLISIRWASSCRLGGGAATFTDSVGIVADMDTAADMLTVEAIAQSSEAESSENGVVGSSENGVVGSTFPQPVNTIK